MARKKQLSRILFFLFFIFLFTHSVNSATLPFIGNKPHYLKTVKAPLRILLNSFLPQKLVRYIETINFPGEIFTSSFNKPIIVSPSEKIRVKSSNSLSVVSANLFLLPYPFSINNKDRISLFRKKMKKYNPDLIGLQEIWLNQDLQELISVFPEYYAVWIPSLFYNRTGLLILSKFPIEKAYREIYPIGIDYQLQELLAQKGFLQITLIYKGKKLNLINTHLYSTSEYSKLKRNRHQFRLLSKHLKKVKKPTIVLGDLNLKPSPLEELNKGFLIYDKLKKTTVLGDKKLDYILTPKNGGLQILQSEAINHSPLVSDHYPIFGILKLN